MGVGFSEERLKQAAEEVAEDVIGMGGIDAIDTDDVMRATSDALEAITATLFTLIDVLVEDGIVSAERLVKKRAAMTAGLDQDLKRFRDEVNARIRESGGQGYEG